VAHLLGKLTVRIPLAAFGLEIGELFRYEYNLVVPWQSTVGLEHDA